MAYIGRSVDIGMFEKQILIPDSVTTTFTLTFAVGSANSLMVVYGGVLQEPQVAYSVSGGGQSIVFSEAPVTGTTTYIIYLGKQLTTPRAAGQETTKQTFSGDGSTTLFTLTDPPVVPAGIMVFVDGILQREGSGNNYVSSGSTISFSSAPDSSAEIDVYTLVKEKVSIDTVADGSITRAKLASSAPYWDAAGNVGINVASPTRKLQISGTGASGVSTANPAVRLDNAATGRFASWELSADANMYLWNGDIGSGSTVFLRGSGSGTETARFDQNGNFLINTAASGTSKIQALQAGVNATSLTTTTVKNLGVKLGFSGTTNSDGYIFGGIAMGGDGEEYAGIAAYDNGSSAATGLMLFTGTTAGVSERMRIDSSGNVGIGKTSSLSAKLDIVGSNLALTESSAVDTFKVSVGSGSTGYSDVYLKGQSSTIALYSNPQGSNYTVNSLVYSSLSSGIISSVALVFGSNTAERMRLDTSGNFLLGTTSTSSGAKMVVNGSVYQYQTANGSAGSSLVNGGYLFGPNNASVYAGIKFLNQYLANNTSEMGFYTTSSAGSATEAMRLSGNGQLLIGHNATGTAGQLQVKGLTAQASTNTYYAQTFSAGSYADTGSYTTMMGFGVEGHTWSKGAIGYTRNSSYDRGYFAFYINTAADSTTCALADEKIRIDGAGNLGINGSDGGARTYIAFNPGNQVGLGFAVSSGTFTNPYVRFNNSAGNTIGTINSNNSTTSYNTSSDYRLKENIAPMTGALAKVEQLKPVTYTWKDSGLDSQGFIAHEIQEIVPDCVTGEKDAVDEDGKPIYQGMDTSFLVATLTAAIQELKAIVDAQAVEIAALKAK